MTVLWTVLVTVLWTGLATVPTTIHRTVLTTVFSDGSRGGPGTVRQVFDEEEGTEFFTESSSSFVSCAP